MSSPAIPKTPAANGTLEGNSARAVKKLCLWGIPSVACFLTVTVLVGLGPYIARLSEWQVVGYGFGFGVVSLSALWTVLGPLSLFTRVPLAMLMTMLAIAAIDGFLLLRDGGTPSEVVLLIGGAGAIQWLGLVLLLILVRLVFGSQVGIPGMCQPSGNQAKQFGIRQLLFWTTGVALTLGILRFVAGWLELKIADWSLIAHGGTTLALLLFYNIILACTIAWTLLTNRNIGPRIAVAFLVILLATLSEQPVFALVQGGGVPFAIFFWINAAGSLCLGVNLLIVRLCGYRLVPSVK